jgi:hypothetical protein
MRVVWCEMKKRPETKPDQKSYHLAVIACQHYRTFRSAIDLLKEMKQEGNMCIFDCFL